MANVSVRKQYFLVGNVQAIKLIANRRIYGCDFRAMVHVWYAFPATGIFVTDRQTGACREKEREREREGERQNKKYERSTSFLRDLSRSGQFRATSYGKRKAFFSITIAVTTSTEKAISRDNRISLEAALHFRIASIIFRN